MKYKFLIYISYSYALPIGNPLEKIIKERGDIVNWFSDLNEGKEAIKHKTNSFNSISEVINYKPDIVLTATDDVPDFISGLKVQIFHGFFSKKRPEKKNSFAHFRIRGFFDLYCTQGPSTTSVFKKLAKKHNYFDVIETGWSKVDPMFPISKETIQKVKTETPIIMIASTFTERLSLAYCDSIFKEIKRLSETNTYKFIMVLHPKLPEFIKEKWKTITNDNFTFYNTTNLVPLFKKSNLLLADTTSVIQEYVLQKKPIVTYKHKAHENFLINILDASKTEAAINEALELSDTLKNHITEYINQLHPYNDGKSSERIIKTTIAFLHKDKSYLKSKPLNLIRKYKIRKRLKYFSLKSYNKPYTIKNKL